VEVLGATPVPHRKYFERQNMEPTKGFFNISLGTTNAALAAFVASNYLGTVLRTHDAIVKFARILREESEGIINDQKSEREHRTGLSYFDFIELTLSDYPAIKPRRLRA
jgi:hypothetical protein